MPDVNNIMLSFQLDISDEFRRSIESLRGHDDKIRIVLNKADMVDHQQLMRVSFFAVCTSVRGFQAS